jgi:prepilin-type N-terminal cleavage/methylation domain-containing protein
METSKLCKVAPARGFSLIETLVAMMVLSIGLVALCSLAAQTMVGTSRSEFMSLAADLATEKLEDLSRWPTFNTPYTPDPNIYAAAGSTAGDLASDKSANVTSGGIPTELVNYYDDVEFSDSKGAVSETVSQVVGGVTNWKTTSHNPDGSITTSTSTTQTAADNGAIGFHRRWTIEMDQPVTGLRRITVLVTMENSYLKAPVTFQMTTVRP